MPNGSKNTAKNFRTKKAGLFARHTAKILPTSTFGTSSGRKRTTQFANNATAVSVRKSATGICFSLSVATAVFTSCKVAREKAIAQKNRERLKFAEIPEQYQGLTFDDYEEDENNRRAKRIAEKIAETGKGGMFLYGKYGVGKTMLAAIIANESVKCGREVIFSKVPDLLRNLRSTFKKSDVTENDVLERIYKIPVLILDDVRRDRVKRFTGDTLFDIIDYRYNAGLQTIMTSNGTLEQVADALNNPTDTNGEKTENGSRIYDRCKVMMPLVEIKGESRRGIR